MPNWPRAVTIRSSWAKPGSSMPPGPTVCSSGWVWASRWRRIGRASASATRSSRGEERLRLVQRRAGALDTAAGLFEQVGVGGVGDSERRALAEGRALYDREA